MDCRNGNRQSPCSSLIKSVLFSSGFRASVIHSFSRPSRSETPKAVQGRWLVQMDTIRLCNLIRRRASRQDVDRTIARQRSSTNTQKLFEALSLFSYRRFDVNMQVADGGDAVLVGAGYTHDVVARLVVSVRCRRIAVGSQLDGVAVRPDVAGWAAVVEVPRFLLRHRSIKSKRIHVCVL